MNTGIPSFDFPSLLENERRRRQIEERKSGGVEPLPGKRTSRRRPILLHCHFRAFPILLIWIAALIRLATAAEPPAVETAPWENVSDEFFKQIGVYDLTALHQRRCVGMAVAPTGEIFIMASEGHGVCVSKDHGETWSVVPGSNVTGRCMTGFSFSMAYPYAGRLAFFCIDGTGGLTLDGGAHWRPFGKLLRMLEYADVDWRTNDPQTIFGLLHEPYYTVLSTNGGQQWRQIYLETENPKDSKGALNLRYGVLDATTLLRAHGDRPGIDVSTDAGQTWTGVAQFQVVGQRPVHYGKKVYWSTTEGVVVSGNGRDWTLTGRGPENAIYGPYFGNREQDFMMVAQKGFFITHDGGQTWQEAAPAFFAPDGFKKGATLNGAFSCFGWDATNNILYTAGRGGSVYRLKLQR